MIKIDEVIKTMTLEEKIGQMIMFGFPSKHYGEDLKEYVEDMKIGGLIYFKKNISELSQVYNLNKIIQENAKIPLFIGIDQEGGLVTAIPNKIVQIPGAMSVSAAGKYIKEYEEIVYHAGSDLKKLGINIDFAPNGDINNNPKNPVINARSFGDNPETVIKYSKAAINGFEKANIMSTIKHFPGHGDTMIDSHLGLPVLNHDIDRLEQIELKPFKEAIRIDAPGIMTSHILFKAIDDLYPSTLSKKTIKELLRDKMGFDGIVITDLLSMHAIKKNFTLEEIVYYAINAGNDILLFEGSIEEKRLFLEIAIKLVKENKIPISRIEESVKRILKYKQRYNVGKMLDSFNEVVDGIGNGVAQKLSNHISDKSLTLIQDNGLLPINNKKTLVLFPNVSIYSLVDNYNQHQYSLGECLNDKYMDVDEIKIPEEITKEEITRIVDKTNEYERIVLCTYNAVFNKAQADLIKDLNMENVIWISLRTPYDYNLDKKAGVYICAYEATHKAFDSISRLLIGELKCTGKIPVVL